MIESILVALISATPPTLMAGLAWWKATKLSKPLEQVNQAVNHRIPGQKRLIEVVDEVATSVSDVNEALNKVQADLRNHQAWHQRQEENDTYEEDQ